MTEYYGFEDENSQVVGVVISEQDLFDRLVDLLKQKLILSEDISQLKKDAKFNKKTNPKGIPLKDVSLIVEAAKLEAQTQFEEYAEKTAAVTAKFKELSKYDD